MAFSKRGYKLGKEWTVEKDHVGPRIENIEHVNKTVENMVQLDEVHPATVSGLMVNSSIKTNS